MESDRGIKSVMVSRVLGALLIGVALNWCDMRPAQGDMPPIDPPNTRHIPVTIELDWGPIEAQVSRRHVVVKGETLRALATRYLGDAKRWKRIAAANPHVVKAPDRIQVGAILWIPPREGPKAAVPLQRYEAFWLQGAARYGFRIAMRASPGELPERWRKGAQLLLLPAKDAEPVVENLRTKEYHTSVSLPASALQAVLYPQTRVATDDPAVRGVDHFRLGLVGGRLVFKVVKRSRFDAKGTLLGDPEDKDTIRDTAREHPKVNAPQPAPLPSLASLDVPPPDDLPSSGETDSIRWSELAGILAALGGLLLVVGVAFMRSRRKGDAPTEE